MKKQSWILPSGRSEIERDRDTKINKAKNFGEYMSEYIETEVNPLSSSNLLHQFL